jgi:2-haloacid dehalogenase
MPTDQKNNQRTKTAMTNTPDLSTTRRQLLVGATLAAGAASQIAIGPAFSQAVSTTGKIKAVAFDLFTIFNPLSVDDVIEQQFPGKGKQLATAWRTRIFEYCWLRTLNQNYVDFRHVLDDALTFTFEAAKVDLESPVRAKLMDAFLQFKPWPDSVAALSAMRKAGIRLAPLSTFTEKMLKTNCTNAGIADQFEHYLTTDRVRAFKPDPRAYRMAEETFKLRRDEIVFAAFGGWDAAGAKSFGLNTFWVNRLGVPIEQLGVTPDKIGSTLTELAQYVTA